MEKEKIPNSLTAEKDLPPPKLVRHPEKSTGRDVIDSEMSQLYKEEGTMFNQEKDSLVKADVTIRILLKEGVVKENDDILTLLQAINLKIYNFLRDLKAILESDVENKNRGETPSADDIDAEFRDLMDTEEIRAHEDIPFLKATAGTIHRLCKTGQLNEKDTIKTAMTVINIEFGGH